MIEAGSNDPHLLLESKLLFETLKQHRKILESSLSPEIKVDLLSSNFEQFFNRVKNFCDLLATHSKELEDIMSETYRSHDIATSK